GKDNLPRKADPALLKALARARRWFGKIVPGRVHSSAEIARHEALQKGYVARLTRLAFLSPTLVEAVVDGRAPATINLQMLMTKRLTKAPIAPSITPRNRRQAEFLPTQLHSSERYSSI